MDTSDAPARTIGFTGARKGMSAVDPEAEDYASRCFDEVGRLLAEARL